MKKAATCMIDNIKLSIIKKWDNKYLTWENWTWVVKYIVYKWNTKKDLVEIAQLTWTEYQLPFDVNTKQDKYAYFAVKAVCDDGTLKQIDKVKRVKVGPMDWIILAFIMTIITYGIKIIYKAEQN
jgi:hypothetical protein